MAKINSFGIDFIESKQNVRPTLRFVENSIPHISQNSAPKSKPNIDAIPSLINETKIYVDSKLKEINLDILKKLEFSYSDLMERDHPHSYARIAFDCREILMDFTDTIFNDESLEDGHRPPKRNETKNKLRLLLNPFVRAKPLVNYFQNVLITL
jgi:hypothetical protein